MGIPDLWKTVSSAQEKKSLEHLCIVEGFCRNSRGTKTLFVGVDISIWFDEITAAVQAQCLHTQGGENPELRILFFKLCHHLALPITLIFVFDGPNRPSVKRSKKVITQPHWMTDAAKELITAFGFYCHDAPGEAEAELAAMNKQGMLDAIITEDSDSLVFGAECVFKKPYKSSNQDEVLMCDLHSIQYTDSVRLTSGGLLLYALLVGGDYSSGVVGCGAKTAHGLAQGPFGDELLDAFQTLSHKDLEVFLSRWRGRIQAELMNNTSRLLRRRQPDLILPSKFPDLSTVEKYVHPVISTSFQLNWQAREPNIHKIARFCTQRLGFSARLSKTFRNRLWKGVFIRMLCSNLLLYDANKCLLATPNTQAKIINISQKPYQIGTTHLWSRKLRISIENFVALTGCHMDDQDSSKALLLCIPEHLLPQAVLDSRCPTSNAQNGGHFHSQHQRLETSDRSMEDNSGSSSMAGHGQEIVELTVDHEIIDLTVEEPEMDGGMTESTHCVACIVDLTADADDV